VCFTEHLRVSGDSAFELEQGMMIKESRR